MRWQLKAAMLSALKGRCEMAVRLLGVSLMCFVLVGCASKSKNIEDLDIPLIEGRPSKNQCTQIATSVEELFDKIDFENNYDQAILIIRDEFDTFLKLNGCVWLYAESQDFQEFYNGCVIDSSKFFTKYINVISKNHDLEKTNHDLKQTTLLLRDVLKEKIDIERAKELLECTKGDGVEHCPGVGGTNIDLY